MDDFEKFKEKTLSNPKGQKEYDTLESQIQQPKKKLKAFGILHDYVKSRKPNPIAEENAWAEAAVKKYRKKMQNELLDT